MLRSNRASARRRTAFRALLATLLVVPAVTGASPPLPKQVPIPVLSYDGAGFAVNMNGRVVQIARQGTRHWDDPTGRISMYTFTDGRMDWPPTTLIDTDLDDRNPAGGMSSKGSLIVFYARSTGKTGWVDLNAARIVDGRIEQTSALPTWPDASYSPYGPLVVLPSGRLMQTVYGWGKEGDRSYYRIRAFFSDDDGRTWPEWRVIWKTYVEMPNETAAVYVDGATDSTARLMAFSRSARWLDDRWVAYVMQHVSTDGGKTWRRVGWVGNLSDRGMIPWIGNIGGGRLALLTVDRRPMTINVSVAWSSRVFSSPAAWPKGRPIYQSSLATTERFRMGDYGQTMNYGDFGYPSIAQLGPQEYQKFVVFYDSHTGDSGWEPMDMPIDTDLILMRLFSRPLDER